MKEKNIKFIMELIFIFILPLVFILPNIKVNNDYVYDNNGNYESSNKSIEYNGLSFDSVNTGIEYNIVGNLGDNSYTGDFNTGDYYAYVFKTSNTFGVSVGNDGSFHIEFMDQGRKLGNLTNSMIWLYRANNGGYDQCYGFENFQMSNSGDVVYDDSVVRNIQDLYSSTLDYNIGKGIFYYEYYRENDTMTYHYEVDKYNDIFVYYDLVPIDDWDYYLVLYFKVGNDLFGGIPFIKYWMNNNFFDNDIYYVYKVNAVNNSKVSPFVDIKNIISNVLLIDSNDITFNIVIDYTCIWFIMFVIWHLFYCLFDFMIHLIRINKKE